MSFRSFSIASWLAVLVVSLGFMKSVHIQVPGMLTCVGNVFWAVAWYAARIRARKVRVVFMGVVGWL